MNIPTRIALATVAILTSLTPCVAKNKTQADPIVMTVGNDKVTLSEFEYLYHKNIEQQSTPTTLDQYLDMFVNYKLKVLAARSAGIDTTQAFTTDIARYSRELAAPYMRDKAVDDSLARAAYSHLGTLLRVSHIMISGQEPDNELRQRADSIHSLLQAGADFGQLASSHSTDRYSASRQGDMGFITAGSLPYTWEDQTYSTPIGSFSPVFRTRFGYHIVKVTDSRKNPGEVKVRHILLASDGSNPQLDATKRNTADSLAQVLRNDPSQFADIARKWTDEPQGRTSGGDLPWFSTGQMVQEFNDAAFNLTPGQVSLPVHTRFGYHIILCEQTRPIKSFEDAAETIHTAILADPDRSKLATDSHLRAMKRAWKATTLAAAEKQARKIFNAAGGINDNALLKLSESKTPAIRIEGETTPLSALVPALSAKTTTDPSEAMNSYRTIATAALDSLVSQHDLATLPLRESAYGNLLREYADGMLLFEISNTLVWDKANTDIPGLQACFEANRGQYRWEAPRYKGYVLAATTDSVADAAIAYLDTTDVSTDRLNADLRKRFRNEVKIERVLAAQHENSVVAQVAFNGPKAKPIGRWTTFRAWAGRIIDQPEDALDVKGAVSAQYQQELEHQWLQQLHATYPVQLYPETLNHLR